MSPITTTPHDDANPTTSELHHPPIHSLPSHDGNNFQYDECPRGLPPTLPWVRPRGTKNRSSRRAAPARSFLSISGRVLKLLIGYQKCSFLRAILARFNKFRTRPYFCIVFDFLFSGLKSLFHKDFREKKKRVIHKNRQVRQIRKNQLQNVNGTVQLINPCKASRLASGIRFLRIRPIFFPVFSTAIKALRSVCRPITPSSSLPQ